MLYSLNVAQGQINEKSFMSVFLFFEPDEESLLQVFVIKMLQNNAYLTKLFLKHANVSVYCIKMDK